MTTLSNCMFFLASSITPGTDNDIFMASQPWPLTTSCI